MEEIPNSQDHRRASVQVQVIRAIWNPIGDENKDFESFYSIARHFAEFWESVPDGEKTVGMAIAHIRKAQSEILSSGK